MSVITDDQAFVSFDAIVMVYPSGRITGELFDVWVGTEAEDNATSREAITAATERLREVVGEGDLVDQLRRLADAIEAQRPEPTITNPKASTE